MKLPNWRKRYRALYVKSKVELIIQTKDPRSGKFPRLSEAVAQMADELFLEKRTIYCDLQIANYLIQTNQADLSALQEFGLSA